MMYLLFEFKILVIGAQARKQTRKVDTMLHIFVTKEKRRLQEFIHALKFFHNETAWESVSCFEIFPTAQDCFLKIFQKQIFEVQCSWNMKRQV